MAEQNWMRATWVRVVLGLVGVVAIVSGLKDIKGGMSQLQQDPSGPAAQGPGVPGYGPPMNGPSQSPVYAPANGPAPGQPMPISQQTSPTYDQPPSAYSPNGPNPSYSPNGPNPSYSPNGPNPSYSPNGPNSSYPPNAAPGGQRYRDPQGRFSVAVPTGWQAMAQNGGVMVTAGNAYAMISPFDGSATSEQVVSLLSQQIGSQWRGMQVVTQGSTMLSGAQGVYMLFRGQSPRGVESLLRIAGASSNGQAWAFIVSAPMQEFNQVSPVLQQIEQSFVVGRQ